MNTNEALSLLKNILGDFDIHPRFLLELAALLKKDLKGKETQLRLAEMEEI